MTAPFSSRLQFSRGALLVLHQLGELAASCSLRPFSGRSLFPSHRFGHMISAIGRDAPRF
jgi:hypothetical protein